MLRLWLIHQILSARVSQIVGAGRRIGVADSQPRRSVCAGGAQEREKQHRPMPVGEFRAMSRSRKQNWGYSIAKSCCSKKQDKAIFHRIYRAHVRNCINLEQFDLIGGKMLKHQRRWTWQCEAMSFSTKDEYSIESIRQRLRTDVMCHHIGCDGGGCWVYQFCRRCGCEPEEIETYLTHDNLVRFRSYIIAKYFGK